MAGGKKACHGPLADLTGPDALADECMVRQQSVLCYMQWSRKACWTACACLGDELRGRSVASWQRMRQLHHDPPSFAMPSIISYTLSQVPVCMWAAP